MQTHSKANKKSKKYSKISLKKRQSLVQQVIHKGQILTKTAKKLNIKLSTAKLILRKYRNTGKLFNKNMKSKILRVPKIEKQEEQIVPTPILQKEQFYISESPPKIEEVNEEIMVTEVYQPVAYYQAPQGSWIVYPWSFAPYFF